MSHAKENIEALQQEVIALLKLRDAVRDWYEWRTAYGGAHVHVTEEQLAKAFEEVDRS